MIDASLFLHLECVRANRELRLMPTCVRKNRFVDQITRDARDLRQQGINGSFALRILIALSAAVEEVTGNGSCSLAFKVWEAEYGKK